MIVMSKKEMTGTTFNAVIFFSSGVQAGACCCDVEEGDDSKSSSHPPSSRTMMGFSSWLASSLAEDIIMFVVFVTRG